MTGRKRPKRGERVTRRFIVDISYTYDFQITFGGLTRMIKNGVETAFADDPDFKIVKVGYAPLVIGKERS